MAALGVLSDFSMAVGVPGYFTWHAIHAVSWPMAVLGVTVLSSYGLVLAALLVRFFRANDQVRRQLSWVLLAVLIVVVIFALDPILPDSLLSILPIALIPLDHTGRAALPAARHPARLVPIRAVRPPHRGSRRHVSGDRRGPDAGSNRAGT